MKINLQCRLPGLLIATLTACALVYVLFTAQFFSAESGRLGHDYAYFLPQMLAAEVWWHNNGLFSPPWFSPHACGGLPLLASPQSVTLSVPQLLFHLLPAARALHLSLLVFAAIGAGASFLLARRRFGCSSEAASLAAVLFLFNGFLTYRMAVGHLTYHVVGLVPVAALLLLDRAQNDAASFRDLVARCCGLGLVSGYFVYAGALNYLGVLGLALLILGLGHRLRYGQRRGFWVLLAGGLSLGLAIGAMKLAPAWVFIEAFPRTAEKMALVNDLPALLGRMIDGLFLPNLLDLAHDTPFEFEYGVSLVALLLVVRATRRHLPAALGALSRQERWVVMAVVALLLAPLALSYGGDAWGGLLKTLPYIKHTVLPYRWWSVYIPVLVIASAVAFDALTPDHARRRLWFAVAALAVVAQATARDGRFYRGEVSLSTASLIERPFDPRPILHAQAEGNVPPIAHLDNRAIDGSGWRNDLMVEGTSPLPCYEPIFGYGQEEFPARALNRGDSLTADAEGWLNVARPECYIYGAANNCRPGDRFSVAQIQDATEFLAYRKFYFIEPWWQSLATSVTCVTVTLAVFGMLGCWPRRRTYRGIGRK